MFGLGKPRSKLGKYLDKNGINQGELSKESKVNKETVSRLANNDADPNEKTMTKIVGALRKKGKDAKAEDFWDV
jgi:predicted transcriptional regulator